MREGLRMKRTMMLSVMAFLFVAGWTFFPQIVQADLEWRIIKDLDLKTTPRDVAPSADGQLIYILTPGEILVYSVQAGSGYWGFHIAGDRYAWCAG